MALIEPRDFPQDALNHFGNDLYQLADKMNYELDRVAQEAQGSFAELARNIDQHRNNLVKLALTTFESIINDQNYQVIEIINMTAMAALAIYCSHTDSLSRYSNSDSRGWIDREFRDNPILIALNNSRGNGSRYDDRQVARKTYNSQGGSSNARYPQQQQQQRHYQQHGGNNGGARYVGRLQQAPQPQEQPMQQQVQERKPEVIAVPDGSVVTTNNVNDVVYKGIAPCYIIGKEQVVIKEGKLLIVPYDGRNAVDYEQHRIDRFYADVLPASSTNLELSRIALNEATKAKDNIIKAFVAETGDKKAEQVKKIFEGASSGKYRDIVTSNTPVYDPVDVRNSLLDNYGASFEWLTDNALIVNIDQNMELVNVSNDTLLRIKELLECTTAQDVVKHLIKLVSFIDTAIWRKLHDIITANFNIKLASLGSGYFLDSITAQWTELVKALTDDEFAAIGILANSSGMCHGITLTESEELNAITITRVAVYLPVNSFDLDIGAVAKENPIHSIPAGSMLHNMLDSNGGLSVSRLISIVTLDGVTSSIFTYIALSGQEYILHNDVV